jgi:hypothetical protein
MKTEERKISKLSDSKKRDYGYSAMQNIIE